MAGRDTYLEHLASVPLFAACSRKDLQRIARASDEVQIPAGRTLMKQDDVGRECFVLVDGKVKVERNGRKVASLGPGAYFGELSLLDKGPRTATVTAESPITVLVLGPREFSAVLDEVPQLAHKLLTARTCEKFDELICPARVGIDFANAPNVKRRVAWSRDPPGKAEHHTASEGARP